MVCRRNKFDLLLSQHVISEEELNQAIAGATERKSDIGTVVVNDFRAPKTVLAKSYEAYYRESFVSFGDKITQMRKVCIE